MQLPETITWHRNDHLFSYARSLLASSVPKDKALEMLREANKRCRPQPLSDFEVRKILGSAYSKPAGWSEKVRRRTGMNGSTRANRSTPPDDSGSDCVRRFVTEPDLGAITIPEPPELDAAGQLRAQTEALFRPGDLINIVRDTINGDPYGAGLQPTYETLMAEPETFLGLADPEHGLWLRHNPTDGKHKTEKGKAEGDADVTDLRSCLLECDPENSESMSEEELEAAKLDQYRRILALRLPCRAITDSGHKSVHAVVQVEDDGEELDREEWQRRTDLVYEAAGMVGLEPDSSCKTPSKMCRASGAMRKGHQQRLLATLESLPDACRTWAEWESWLDSQTATEAEEAAAPAGNVPQHYQLAQSLVQKREACIIDGIPAIRDADGRWQRGWTAVERAILDYAPTVRSSVRKEVLSLLNLEAPRREQASKYIIAFRNGFLDVRTMELSPTCDEPILDEIPHDWNPDAASEVMDATLNKLADGNPETLANMEEAAGLCLYRCSSDYQYIFALVGDGSNGKSVYMDAIRCMLGQDNISAMQPEELTARFQAEQLMGRLAMLADDASSSTINEGLKAIMKRLSAGNVLHTDVKHYPGCEFVPYCTMLISWNRFPKVSSSDFGFMRRLVPVPFMHTFRKTDPDYDSTIRDSLREEQAQERLLVHAVEGLRRLIRQDQPTGNHAADLLKAEIEAEGDSVYSWMEDEGIEQDSLIGQRTSDVYGRYKGYCEANGIEKPDDARWFGRKVKARLQLKTVKCTAKGSQYREYAPAG